MRGAAGEDYAIRIGDAAGRVLRAPWNFEPEHVEIVSTGRTCPSPAIPPPPPEPPSTTSAEKTPEEELRG